MSKHSEGPWRLEKRDSNVLPGDTWDEVVDANGVAVVEAYSDDGAGSLRGETCMRDEDARLIVAAPELLRAVRESVGVQGACGPCERRADDGLPGECSWCDRARALITKIENGT